MRGRADGILAQETLSGLLCEPHSRASQNRVTEDHACFRWAYKYDKEENGGGALLPRWLEDIPNTAPVSVVLDERTEGAPRVYVQGIEGARMWVTAPSFSGCADRTQVYLRLAWGEASARTPPRH